MDPDPDREHPTRDFDVNSRDLRLIQLNLGDGANDARKRLALYDICPYPDKLLLRR